MQAITRFHYGLKSKSRKPLFLQAEIAGLSDEVIEGFPLARGARKSNDDTSDTGA
jgi:hypothetical protein